MRAALHTLHWVSENRSPCSCIILFTTEEGKEGKEMKDFKSVWHYKSMKTVQLRRRFCSSKKQNTEALKFPITYGLWRTSFISSNSCLVSTSNLSFAHADIWEKQKPRYRSTFLAPSVSHSSWLKQTESVIFFFFTLMHQVQGVTIITGGVF